MKKENMTTFRGWEYSKRGDYHRNLDPNWSYTPTYIRKMTLVHNQIIKIGQKAKILDAGCGEGVLVEEYHNQGFQIEGLDLNYESEIVRRGSVLEMPYQNGSFDAVLFLDVFEHLGYADQPKALAEIIRVLRPGGRLIVSIPNLAHWNSRFRIACFGTLDRSDTETNHIGERPYGENRKLLVDAGFQIEKTVGITLTVPFVYRGIICRKPARFRWLHDLLEPFAVPQLAMLNVFICRKS
ncbi:MAG: class I SAM-dependent methyltransferase [bacterium]|nr:class I SAM-dependent methyltransferase [bacterium]